MQCFTLDRPGIRLVDGAIQIGQAGPRRKLERMSIPPGSTVIGDLLLAIPSRHSGVLVRVPDQSDRHGGWRLRGARPMSEWRTIVKPCSQRLNCTQAAHVDGCPKKRLFDEPERKPDCIVLAEGLCAHGVNGDKGGGSDMLIRLEEDAAVEIVKLGRLKSAARVLRVAVIGGLPVLSNPRAAAEAEVYARKSGAGS